MKMPSKLIHRIAEISLVSIFCVVAVFATMDATEKVPKPKEHQPKDTMQIMFNAYAIKLGYDQMAFTIDIYNNKDSAAVWLQRAYTDLDSMFYFLNKIDKR